MHQQKAVPGAGDAEDLKTSINADRDLLNEKATGAKRARDQNIAAVLELLAETWPACFSIYEQRRRPLKLKIHLDIIAILDGAVTPAELSRALRYYCRNRFYLRGLRAGAVRIDLDGNPAGVVTENEVRDISIRPKPPAAERKATINPPDTKPRRLGLADLRKAALERKAVSS
jgi:ProP effector